MTSATPPAGPPATPGEPAPGETPPPSTGRVPRERSEHGVSRPHADNGSGLDTFAPSSQTPFDTAASGLLRAALDQRNPADRVGAERSEPPLSRSPLSPDTPIDDLDSRPGSSTSLVRTIVGATLRAGGGWMPTARLVALARAAELSEGTARSAISRVRSAGLLLTETRDGVAGHALNPAAVPMLERGDRRIFDYRQMRATDAWCLVSFSIPESRRADRHQLRRRLAWIGCGTVAPALWVCPESLADEVRVILAELGLGPAEATVFTGARPFDTEPDLNLADSAARWWDLPRIRALHDHFLEVTDADAAALGIPSTTAPRRSSVRDEGANVSRPGVDGTSDLDTPSSLRSVGTRSAGEVGTRSVEASGGDDSKLFRIWITTLDAWRTIPYLDPGLPAEALPADWPGAASLARFTRLRIRCEDAALAYALELDIAAAQRA